MACPRAGPDPVEEARALQSDLHRAFVTTRALGRFGTMGLFEEEMDKVPCTPPLSATNRVCNVVLVGKGPVRMRVSAADDPSRQLRRDALLSVEYQPECANARFDFKTVDQALPRVLSREDETVWENKLLRVTYRRLAWTPADKCTLTIEAAPELLTRVQAVGALSGAP